MVVHVDKDPGASHGTCRILWADNSREMSHSKERAKHRRLRL